MTIDEVQYVAVLEMKGAVERLARASLGNPSDEWLKKRLVSELQAIDATVRTMIVHAEAAPIRSNS